MKVTEWAEQGVAGFVDLPAILAKKAVGTTVLGIEGCGSDRLLVGQWLSTFHNERTIACASKEVERLFLWLQFHRLGIDDVEIDHARQYINHLKSPEPASHWIGPKTRKYLNDGTRNSQWRCFHQPLGVNSIRLSYSMCRSFFKHLVAAGRVSKSPFEGLRIGSIKKSKSAASSKKALSRSARAVVLESLVELEKRSAAKAKRYRWIYLLLLMTGLRRAECAAMTVGNLWESESGALWINVIGKGSVEGNVRFPAALIPAFEDYYASNGGLPKKTLSEIRFLAPDTPLVGAYLHAGEPVGMESIWSAVKEIGRVALKYGKDTGVSASVLNELDSLSTHWLRHTCASIQVNELKLNVIQVRDNMRHGNVSVTSGYMSTENEDRHAQINAWVVA